MLGPGTDGFFYPWLYITIYRYSKVSHLSVFGTKCVLFQQAYWFADSTSISIRHNKISNQSVYNQIPSEPLPFIFKWLFCAYSIVLCVLAVNQPERNIFQEMKKRQCWEFKSWLYKEVQQCLSWSQFLKDRFPRAIVKNLCRGFKTEGHGKKLSTGLPNRLGLSF